MINYPIRVPAIAIEQPIGTFFAVALSAEVLLQVCYSERLSASLDDDGITYSLKGVQRELLIPRLKQIANYVDSEEVAFPNSIILAANYAEIDGALEEDDDLRWRIETLTDSDGNLQYSLVIPSAKKLAPIIDGQHRLFSFNFSRSEKLRMPLLCSVFMDLPKPFQAYLFATINSNQKPVTKSLTYEHFGYNIENELPEAWSPDKLAVSLARKLNVEEDSPFKNRILIAAKNGFSISKAEAKSQGYWMISMATVVEGIVKLFSSNAKRDRNQLADELTESRRTREILRNLKDSSPLRDLYLDGNDKVIYLSTMNFFRAANTIFWKNAKEGSYITKTVGIQALFDIFRDLAGSALKKKDFSERYFADILSKAENLDFSSQIFVNASGSGRTAIKTCIAICIGLIDKNSSLKIKEEWRVACQEARPSIDIS